MNQTTQILDVFSNFRMAPMAGDQYEEIGKTKLEDKLRPFILMGLPIDFVMLGYPMKSPNDRDKVIGKLPDLGEELSFKNFTSFNEQIKKVYEPGVNIHIVSDGYIFSDIMEVSDSVVREYEERNKELSSAAPITWYDMTDFYSKTLPISDMREKVMEQFGISAIELEQRILMDPDVNSLYRGMITFMEGDLAIRDFVSNSQLHKKSKIVAREMMFRNEAYSRLIESNFANHVRLSMHPSVNNGKKFSFQLIPSPKAKHSPWHAAVLINKDGTLETIHRKEAIARGCELVYENNQPYYFQEI